MPKIPGVNHSDAVRALEKAGFAVIRQGKHIVMSDGTGFATKLDFLDVSPCRIDVSPYFSSQRSSFVAKPTAHIR